MNYSNAAPKNCAGDSKGDVTGGGGTGGEHEGGVEKVATPFDLLARGIHQARQDWGLWGDRSAVKGVEKKI